LDPPRRPDRPQPSLAASVTIILILVGFGSAGWWLHLRPERELDPESIQRIPLDLAGWQGRDVPLDEGVERMLRADAHVQRSYRNDRGELVWLYVGYYGTERGGRPEHTPWVCYPSAGWLILASGERPLSVERGDRDGARMVELVVERQRERRLVHFWYRTTRSEAIASERTLTVDHVLGRFSPSGRADGALVRLSTPIAEGGIERARDRLARFADPLVGALEAHWPTTVAGEDGRHARSGGEARVARGEVGHDARASGPEPGPATERDGDRGGERQAVADRSTR
jgi:EpsI family protein